MKAICRLTLNTIPNHKGSKPKVLSMGRKMGKVIMTIDILFSTIPRKKKLICIIMSINQRFISNPPTNPAMNLVAPSP